MKSRKSKINYYSITHRADNENAVRLMKKLKKELEENKKRGKKSAVLVESYPESKEIAEKAKILFKAVAKGEEELKRKERNLPKNLKETKFVNNKPIVDELGVLKRLAITDSHANIITEPYSKKAASELKLFDANLAAAQKEYEQGNYEEYMKHMERVNRHLAKHMKSRDIVLLKEIKKIIKKNPETEIYVERGGAHPLYSMIKRDLGDKVEVELHGKPDLMEIHKSAGMRALGFRDKGKKVERLMIAKAVLEEEMSKYGSQDAKKSIQNLTEKDIKEIFKEMKGTKDEHTRGTILSIKLRMIQKEKEAKNKHS